MMIDESLAEEISKPTHNLPPIISGHFILILDEVQYSDCIAYLFQKQIILQLDKNGKKIYLKVKIDFDLIFQLLRQKSQSEACKKGSGSPYGIKFERYQKYLEILTKSGFENLFKWRNQLALMINQRGFHQLFRPIKKIGKGNFASVYLVVKHEDEKKYAVKAFSKEGTFSEDKGKQSLINEIQIMRKLKHKNLMTLYQIYESQNSIYVAVQLLEGGQLYDKIKSKYCFTSYEIKIIMRGLLEGLEAMHAQRIMHRDLKPQNILFRKQGDWDCVIADFGLSTYAQQQEYLFVRCGTPGYVAPQVVNLKDLKAKYDPICDMFSLGVIFHMLTLKKSPFPGKEYNEVLNQNKQCCINFDSDLYKKIPSTWLNLLMRLLEKNPKKRITASQALKHQFFKDNNQNNSKKNSILIQEKQNLSVDTKFNKNNQTCDSPLMTTKNQSRKNPGLLREDSCLKFKMKQNLMTGRVDPNEDSIDQIDSPTLIKAKKAMCAQSRFKKISSEE